MKSRVELSNMGMKQLRIHTEYPPIKCSYETCYFYSRVSYHPIIGNPEETWCALREVRIYPGEYYHCDGTFFLKHLISGSATQFR